MAKQGNFTAYQQLRPIDINWGDVAKVGVERKDLLDQRKAQAQKDEAERRSNLNYEDILPVVTGVSSIDEAYSLGIEKATILNQQNFKRAMEDPDYAGSAEFKIKEAGFKNYAKNLEAASQQVATIAKEVSEMGEDLSDWDGDLMGMMNSFYTEEKFAVDVDPRDGSAIFYFPVTDPDLKSEDNPQGFVLDDNGKPKLKKTTAAEMAKRVNGMSITPKVDIEKEVLEIGTKLAASAKDEVKGFNVTTKQLWEDKRESVRTIARGMLGSKNSPTPLAKRLWADIMGEKSRTLTDEDMTKMEEVLLDKMGVYYEQKLKQDPNFAAMNAAADRAQRGIQEDTGGGGIQLSVNTTTGEPLLFQTGTLEGDIREDAFTFTLPVVRNEQGMASPKIIIDIAGQEVGLENIYLGKDSGRIIYKGYKTDGKQTGIPGEDAQYTEGGVQIGESSKISKDVIKEEIGGYLTDAQVNRVARGLGFNNASELRKELQSIKNNYIQNNQGSTGAVDAFGNPIE